MLSGLRKLRAVVAGGSRRQDSVLAGLKQAPDRFDGVVLVHDAARPFVEPSLIDAVASAAAADGAALPVAPVVDTVKRVAHGRVVDTLDREELAAAQTPQGFRFDAARSRLRGRPFGRAHGHRRGDGGGGPGRAVVAVPGSLRNRKITTPEDLLWAEGLLREERAREPGLRVGNGFDAHRLVAGRPLRLGGVDVPHARGLEGHSDGDCAIHAVCDALLGAVGAGDMGAHFPSREARWRGVESRVFLEETARLVADAGFEIDNLDVTIVAQEPVLAPHLDAMRRGDRRDVLGSTPDDVSVKAKSTDGLGALGRGEGIAALATVLVLGRTEQS